MNKRQSKNHKKKLGNLLAPWEMIKYEPICWLCGGEAMKPKNMERTREMRKRLGYPDYPDR